MRSSESLKLMHWIGKNKRFFNLKNVFDLQSERGITYLQYHIKKDYMLLTLPMKKKNGNKFSFDAHTFKMSNICIKLQNISCLICCLLKADLLPANGIFRIVMSTKCFKYFSL